MSVEDKLDEDFLFYLGFTSTVVPKLKEYDRPKAQLWLQKLCGEACKTISQKRNRNIFLSNLLLDLEEKQLTGPFAQNPSEINFENAAQYFPEVATEVNTPAWVHEVDQMPPVDDGEGRIDGRTYVATRSMPGGEGAFAYVAVSMSDEPMFLGGGEGVFDKVMEQKHKEYVPPQSEMEVILSRRKDAHERQRVITFYEVTLQNIADELDGKIKMSENSEINGLMDQFISDLQKNGQFEPYARLSEQEQRYALLQTLYALTNRRKIQTQTREEVLDHIGQELNSSFFEATGIAEENKYELPAAMWEYCINRPPGKRNLDILRGAYPPFVVETFLQLMANMKEEIAQRMNIRHVNIISQMKQELKNEGDKLKKWVDDMQKETDQMEAILVEVRAARAKQWESQQQADSRKKGGETDLTGLYEGMKAALYETQIDVEQEAERGQFLAQQINAINAQTEAYNDISEKTIRMTEEANIELMKNIKRLQGHVRMHEARLNTIKQMQNANNDDNTTQMIIM